jgi:hypothetical protein
MAYTLVDSLVRASIPAVVLTVFALARRYFPAKSAREFGTAYSIEELNLRFKAKQWLFGGGVVLNWRCDHPGQSFPSGEPKQGWALFSMALLNKCWGRNPLFGGYCQCSLA